jgi:hypothetical protein
VHTLELPPLALLYLVASAPPLSLFSARPCICCLHRSSYTYSWLHIPGHLAFFALARNFPEKRLNGRSVTSRKG